MIKDFFLIDFFKPYAARSFFLFIIFILNHLFFRAICFLVTRPKKSPIMNMNPINVNITIMKYRLAGDATTVSYRSDKLSACGATCIKY